MKKIDYLQEAVEHLKGSLGFTMKRLSIVEQNSNINSAEIRNLEKRIIDIESKYLEENGKTPEELIMEILPCPFCGSIVKGTI